MTQNKNELIEKYSFETFKERVEEGYKSKLIPMLEKDLEKLGALKEAKERAEREIEEIKVLEGILEASKKLFNIFENFSIWKTGKFNEEIKKVKEILKKDTSYVGRINLYKKLMNFPKFKELEEDKKIKIAMQLGALDFSEFGFRED